jgi:hypothetical protein
MAAIYWKNTEFRIQNSEVQTLVGSQIFGSLDFIDRLYAERKQVLVVVLGYQQLAFNAYG